MLEEQAKVAQVAKEEEFEKDLEEKKQKAGFLAKVNVYASAVGHNAGKAVATGYGFVEKKVEETISEKDLKRFRDAFPELKEEELLGDFACHLLNLKTAVK
eukprot:EG_transcript_70912